MFRERVTSHEPSSTRGSRRVSFARVRPAAALCAAGLLLGACNFDFEDKLSFLFGEPVIVTSSYDKFLDTYGKTVAALEDENPAMIVQIRDLERKYFTAKSFDFKKLDLGGAPPELTFDKPSNAEGMRIIFRNVAAQMEGLDAYALPRIYQSGIDAFASEYVALVDQEIDRIKEEIASVEAARGEIDLALNNLIVDKVVRGEGEAAIYLLNGSSNHLQSALLNIGGYGEEEVHFGPTGLSAGKQGKLLLGHVPEDLGRHNISVMRVTLASGAEISADDVYHALHLLSARLSAFEEFREGLEERLKEAL